jgi:D-mannonate dehydratase
VQKAENSELTLAVVARTKLHSPQCPVFGLVRVMNTAQPGCWLSQLCGIQYCTKKNGFCYCIGDRYATNGCGTDS